MGNGDDLDIYHNGSSGNNNIENNLGDLYITQNKDDGDIYFRSDNGSGGVTNYFYLDGSITKRYLSNTRQKIVLKI